MLLESEWVLRAAYGFSANEILTFFRALLGLASVSTHDSERVAAALNHYEQGLDFADALHIALNAKADAFATFDKKLVRLAQRITAPVKVISP